MNQKLKIDCNTAIHCPTEELAKEVFKIFFKYGIGNDYKDKRLFWHQYCNDICYKINRNGNIVFSDIPFAEGMGYKVISAEEFIKLHTTMTPKEILINAIENCSNNKVIVVKTEDMGNYIAINRTTLLSAEYNGFNLLSSYYEDLQIISKISKFGIKEIWKVPAGDNLSHFNESISTLIWKRKEIKEVTLEEIANKFGVNVENIRIKD